MPLDPVDTDPLQSNRSTFVTVVAWIFITLGGIATFISILQALMFAFVFPASEISPAAGRHAGLEEMPTLLRFMTENIQLFFVAFWSLSVATLVSAVGLLRRKNWARLVFVGLMLLGIVWNLGGIWFQEQMMSDLPTPLATQGHGAQGAVAMMTIMRIAMIAFAIGLSLIFSWIMKQLMSRPVRMEFGALRPPV